jgi:hypothetical protein
MWDKVMDGLDYLGSSLDKLGSRELRGALTGKPRELLSFVPFSDELGITNPHDVSSGRDVLDYHGILGKDDNSLGAHLAGAATEALLDPALLGLGAAKAAPRLAKRWNILGDLSTGERLASKAAREGGYMKFPAFPGESRELNNAADYLGPGHMPSRHLDLIESGTLAGTSAAAMENRNPGDLNRALAEISPNARHAGTGAEAVVFRQPGHSPMSHWATRVGPGRGLSESIPSRASIPEVLQPFRANIYGATGTPNSLSVEHLPWVSPVLMGGGESENMRMLARSLENSGRNAQAKEVRDLLMENLFGSADLGEEMGRHVNLKYGGDLVGSDLANEANVAFLGDVGNPRILTHDPTAIVPRGIANRWPRDLQLNPEAKQFNFLPPFTPGRPGDAIMEQALSMGAPHKIEQALEYGAMHGHEGQGIVPTGKMMEHFLKATQARARLDEIYGNMAPQILGMTAPSPVAPRGWASV